MDLDVLLGLFKTVVEDHKAGIRFFSGLEKDFDPANENNYPAIIVIPPQDALDIATSTTGNSVSDTWNVIVQYHEILIPDRSPTELEDSLNRSNIILKQVLSRLFIRYGQEERDFTYNNKTERLNFKSGSPINMLSFTDVGENNSTGWEATVSIVDEVPPDACCDDDAFNTVLT